MILRGLKSHKVYIYHWKSLTRATLSVAAYAWHICFHLESVVSFTELYKISSGLGFHYIP